MSVFEMKDVSYSYDKSKKILTAVNAVFETGKCMPYWECRALERRLCYHCLAGLMYRKKVKFYLMVWIFQSIHLNTIGAIMFHLYFKVTISLTI